MSTQETSDGDLRARAGALTLFFMTSAVDREVLLQMLANARSGGALREVDPEEYEEYKEREEDEDFDIDEEIEAAEAEELEFGLDPGEFGPHTKARATPAGVEFLFVAFTLQRWLRNCPRGLLEIGIHGAGDAIAALICCWSATVIHGLAAAPRTLPELNEAVEPLEMEVLEEHVAAMERTGLVEARSGRGGATRYAVTDWLREGIAPIAAATRHEFHHPLGDVLPPDRLDVEATFQLALPLIALPAERSGTCRLGVQFVDSDPAAMVGVTARVEGERVVSCESRLDEQAETRVTGSAVDWLDTMVDPSAGRLEVGGDAHLAEALTEGLYESLFGIRVG